MHRKLLLVNMVSTRLFLPQSQTVSSPNCLLYLNRRTEIFLISPMKHVFAHAYTLRHHPCHATSLWSPDKHVPPQFTLDFPFLKITLANYSFSHTSIIVQLLFMKAAAPIASWYSTSVIAACRQINASQPWSKVPQLFKVMSSLCELDRRQHM